MLRNVQLAFALALVSCAHGSALDARIDDLLTRAKTEEPAVTARLKGLASENNAAMIKLEYRLKTRKSMTRKLNKMATSQPELQPSELEPSDALRYTMEVADSPPGQYLKVVQSVMATLEADGHRALRIKNYWPRGDSYSGLNCVLMTTAGTHWELQFHTPQSLQVQASTRAQYEELRLLATPLATKQRIFDAMTAAWGTVPIPVGLLTDTPIHRVAKKRILDRP